MNNYTEDSNLTKEVEKLYQLTVYGRWLFVVISWLIILPFALWQMRETLSLCREYCTWATVRVGIEFTPFSSLGIVFCLAVTISTLVWQSLYILEGGLSEKETYYLQQKVIKIKNKGTKHILYKWIFSEDNKL